MAVLGYIRLLKNLYNLRWPLCIRGRGINTRRLYATRAGPAAADARSCGVFVNSRLKKDSPNARASLRNNQFPPLKVVVIDFEHHIRISWG